METTSVEAIAIDEQQYKTYILSDRAARSVLRIVPERGGIVTSWRIQDREILYLDKERFANPDLSVRGGIPILFPICGNLPENTYTYKGRQYPLKQHGFARDMPWEVQTPETSQQKGVSLTLLLDSNDQTRSVYPFDFQLAFTYQLVGDALEIHQRFTNHSDEPMPFSTGLHPYFEVSDKTQLKFQIPGLEYTDQRSRTNHSFDGAFDFNVDEIDVIFRQLTAQSASATDSNNQFQLSISWDNAYSNFVFWTVKDKDYYCMEPWTAPRNSLNTGDQLIHLEPKASLETLVRMTVTFL